MISTSERKAAGKGPQSFCTLERVAPPSLSILGVVPNLLAWTCAPPQSSFEDAWFWNSKQTSVNEIRSCTSNRQGIGVNSGPLSVILALQSFSSFVDWISLTRERETEREVKRGRERESKRERERDREIDRDRESKRERDIKRESKREWEREKRERESKREREQERERARESKREGERDIKRESKREGEREREGGRENVEILLPDGRGNVH